MGAENVVPLFDEDKKALQRRVEGYIAREFHTHKAFADFAGISQTTLSRGLRDGFNVLGTVATLSIQDALARLDADPRDAATQLVVKEAERNASRRTSDGEKRSPHRYTRDETDAERVALRDTLAPLFDSFNSAEDFYQAVVATFGYKRPSATLYRQLFNEKNYPQSEWVWRIMRQIDQRQDDVRAHANGRAPIGTSHRHVVRVADDDDSPTIRGILAELRALHERLARWQADGLQIEQDLIDLVRKGDRIVG